MGCPSTGCYERKQRSQSPLVPISCHTIGDEIITYSEKINPVKWDITHSTKRETVTVNELFVASKEEQHQTLYYSEQFPQEFYAVKFPVIISENSSPKQKTVCNNFVPSGKDFMDDAGISNTGYANSWHVPRETDFLPPVWWFLRLRVPKIRSMGSQHPSPHVKNPLQLRAAKMARYDHITWCPCSF